MERHTSENSSVPASELGRDKEETNRAVVVGPEMSGESEWNVVTMPQGQHVGRLGWSASKGRPELLEAYRQASSCLRHWNLSIDIEVWRTFEWLEDRPLGMHQFLDQQDMDFFVESGREDFPLAAVAMVYLRVVLYTDVCHEFVSVTGYIVCI